MTMRRRDMLAGLGSLAISLPFAVPAQARLVSTLLSLLGQASDTTLSKLEQPGAFYADPAIRIGLPMIGGGLGQSGLGKGLGSALDIGQQLGVGDNLIRKLNDGAGIAAGQAKSVFRSAIGRLTVADVPGIATQSDGATQYLRQSAGADLKQRLRPMIDAGLLRSGAIATFERVAGKSKLLRTAGITTERLGDSVTDQALVGIFKYLGTEEARLRADPLGAAGGLLKGLGN